MVGIIIKGGATHKQDNRKLEEHSKDKIHHRRKLVEQELRKSIFSKNKMNQSDCRDTDEEIKRVTEYDNWKKTKTTLGKTNEQLMSEWGNLNRAMKHKGEEGKPMCADFIRARKSVKYE